MQDHPARSKKSHKKNCDFHAVTFNYITIHNSAGIDPDVFMWFLNASVFQVFGDIVTSPLSCLFLFILILSWNCHFVSEMQRPEINGKHKIVNES